MSKLEDLVDRLEKVNTSLEKRQTLPLREERNELMVEIQQIRQKQREAAGPPSGTTPHPGTVSGGIGVNGE